MKTSAIALLAFAFIGLSCTQQKNQNVPSKNQDNTATDLIIEKPLLAQQHLSENVISKTPYYVTAGSGLSLRKGSNLQSEKLLTLPFGAQLHYLYTPEDTEMTIDGIKGAMIAVTYQGAKGFVFDGYTSSIAPPHEDESVASYAKRISNEGHKINFSTQPHPKGDTHGKTTQIILPTKDLRTTLTIARRLFDLPKCALSLPDYKKNIFVNPDKRTQTLKDEFELKRNSEGAIEAITYTYQIKDYGRSIHIVKDDNTYTIKEMEGTL